MVVWVLLHRHRSLPSGRREGISRLGSVVEAVTITSAWLLADSYLYMSSRSFTAGGGRKLSQNIYPPQSIWNSCLRCASQLVIPFACLSQPQLVHESHLQLVLQPH